MNMLIVYATNSGSTELVAKRIKTILQNHNHEANLVNAKDVSASTFMSVEFVIFGTPSWDYKGQEGMPHEDVIKMFERLNTTDLSKLKVAVFGCGDRSYAYFCEGVTKVIKSLNDLKVDKFLIDPLKIDGYYFDIENNNQLVEEWAKNLSIKIK